MTKEKVIKILLVTTELRPGGAEKCLCNLACHLDPARFQPIVVSLRSAPPPAEQKLVDLLKEHQIPLHFLDCDSHFASFRAVSQLKKIIQENEIDLIQSFLFHANVMCGIAAKQFPTVPLFTGIRVAEPKRTRHWIEKWFTTGATRIICVSESVRQFAQSVMGLAEPKLVAIPNGLEIPELQNNSDVQLQDSNSSDPELVDAKSFGIERPYFAFVGRLEKQKGLVEFLTALNQSDSLSPDFDLVFVGQGSCLDELKRISNRLRQHCHFVGWQEFPQQFMRDAVAVILPSLWEGMPNVLLEAMSVGVPFVAFNVDGVKEIVSKDPFQLVEPDDYESFFQKMMQFLTEPDLAQRVGAKNRDRVENDFSLEKMIASYESIYLAALDRPN